MILILFLIFIHPLILVLLLTIQTAPVVLLIINRQENTWMGYMLFLIFLGGLLVVFIYLSAIVPNEIFMLRAPMIITSITLPILLVIYTAEETQKAKRLIVPQFSQTHIQSILPLTILYLLIRLCAVIFVCSFIKTPIKQQIN